MYKGVVIKSTGSWYTVDSSEGVFECRLKGNYKIKGIKTTNPIAVGDRVSFSVSDEKGIGLIEIIHERNNYIIRKSVNLSKQTHIIASNIDQAVLVVTLCLPRTSSGFIDRFAVTAEAYHIPVKLVFNKSDLYDRKLNEQLEEWIETYEKVGYTCIVTSLYNRADMELFRTLMSDKVSLISGHSGVGKSALVNAIEPALNLKTAIISDFSSKGKHTTTFAQMHKLSSGGYVIDTPGIKEFGLIDFDKNEIPRCFPEMERFLPQCQYRNCTHVHEPNCAVKQALKSGEVSELRYNSYLSILTDSA